MMMMMMNISEWLFCCSKSLL